MKFTFLMLGSKELMGVLRYINNHRIFDHLGQSAVWSITNHISLRGVYDSDQDSLSKKLIDTICSITGQGKPDYYTMTPKNVVPGEAAYTAKTLKIVAPFDFVLRSSSIMTAGVYDEKGRMIQTIFERRRFEKGRHDMQLTFDAEPYGAGNYYIRLSDPEKMLKEKKVVAEE